MHPAPNPSPSVLAAAMSAGISSWFPVPQSPSAAGWPSAPRPADRPDQSALPHELPALSRSRLAALPGVEPLLAGTLDRESIALLAGPTSAGKSLLALSWACSVATGVPWADRQVAAPGRVVFVAGEGAPGLPVRLHAWEQAHGVPVDDAALTVVPSPVNLLDPGAVDALCRLVAGARLVIIDPWARCLGGADENAPQDAARAIDALDRLRAAGDRPAVLVLHAFGRAARVRGSSALDAAADTVHHPLAGRADGAELQRTKRRHGPRADLVRLRLVESGPSCVVLPAQRPQTGATARRKAPK